jgi:hypothetical protein
MPSTSASKRLLLSQFSHDQVAILNPLRLDDLQGLQHGSSPRRIVATPVKLRDPLLLIGNMANAFGDMPVSFLKVPQLHFAIHDAPYAKKADPSLGNIPPCGLICSTCSACRNDHKLLVDRLSGESAR